jgi:hypothetical protein
MPVIAPPRSGKHETANLARQPPFGSQRSAKQTRREVHSLERITEASAGDPPRMRRRAICMRIVYVASCIRRVDITDRVSSEGRPVDTINAVTGDFIEADGAEAPRVARRAAQDTLTRSPPDERLPKNPLDVVQQVALEYRRAYSLATAAGATVSDRERAAVDAAIRKHQELDPAAPFNRHDAVATTFEMVGRVILADHLWFWHGPDA